MFTQSRELRGTSPLSIFISQIQHRYGFSGLWRCADVRLSLALQRHQLLRYTWHVVGLGDADGLLIAVVLPLEPQILGVGS